MRIELDKGAIAPTRAYSNDAGIDLYSPVYGIVPAMSGAVVDTGVHVELPSGTVGFVKSRSGLNFKHGIQCEGVIDEGYTGSIRLKLYNNSGEDYCFARGDRLAQLVIFNVLKPDIEIVESIDGFSSRNSDGFGSTGR